MSKENNDIAIKVSGLSKSFKLPHEKHDSIKSMTLNFRKSRTYEVQKALKDINFEVKKGEFFGIVGRNGSGKSTLLKCIAGVYSPTEGGISVNGSLVPFIELGVGFNPELSGRDNIFLNGALLGFSRKQMEDMYDEIVEFAELEKFMDQKLKNYSSGMQVRLAFSIAIQAKGDILVLDEVLAVGDEAFQRKCTNYFEDLKRSNATVVLVTHNMGAVQRFCDRAILIDSGEIKNYGKSTEIADEYSELNLRKKPDGKKIDKEKDAASVSVEITSQTSKELTFKMAHELEFDDNDLYFGFSLVKEGNTFAELNSLKNPKAKIVNKSLSYKYNIEDLNPGTYEISASIFDSNNRNALGRSKKRGQFIIKGYDENRGSAIKIDGEWINAL